MPVIATAGHVDHGKSALVRALTGIEPDRYREERERGLTLDLGFAHTTTSDGVVLDLVDVPGHVDYLRTMIAGMAEASIALLVVDAREGMREQTREHLLVIESLGVSTGVVAISRVDLVDGERLREVRDDIVARLRTSSVTWSAVVDTSATEGIGIAELSDELARAVEACAHAGNERNLMPARLFIDRSFTVAGRGTVVTGTLGAGALAIGDELIHARTGARTQVRGLQRHGNDIQMMTSGGRIAVNLTDIAVNDLARGDALIAPGSWHETDVADVAVQLVANATLGTGRGLTAHIGSARIPVNLRPVGGDSGIEHQWHRCRFESPLPLVPGDRCVLRRTGDGEVVGSFTVNDVHPVARPSLAQPDGTFDEQLRHHGWVTVARAAMLTGRVVEPHVAGMVAAQSVVNKTRAALLQQLVVGEVDLATLSPVERELIQQTKGVTVEHGRARTAQHDAALDSPLLRRLREEGLSTSAIDAADRQVLSRLVRLGAVVGHDDVYFHHEVIESLRPSLEALWSARPDGFTVAELRDALGITRKHALPLVNCLDHLGLTKRVGDHRVRGRATHT